MRVALKSDTFLLTLSVYTHCGILIYLKVHIRVDEV